MREVIGSVYDYRCANDLNMFGQVVGFLFRQEADKEEKTEFELSGLIAEELEVTGEELLNWQSQLKVTNMVSLNEYLEQGMEPAMDAKGNSHFIQPEDAVAEDELKKVLEQSLEVLTEKERKVITLYYYEDLTLKEISNVLEVSESRISQLHTKALMKMKKTMGPYMNILTD